MTRTSTLTRGQRKALVTFAAARTAHWLDFGSPRAVLIIDGRYADISHRMYRTLIELDAITLTRDYSVRLTRRGERLLATTKRGLRAHYPVRETPAPHQKANDTPPRLVFTVTCSLEFSDTPLSRARAEKHYTEIIAFAERRGWTTDRTDDEAL